MAQRWEVTLGLRQGCAPAAARKSAGFKPRRLEQLQQP